MAALLLFRMICTISSFPCEQARRNGGTWSSLKIKRVGTVLQQDLYHLGMVAVNGCMKWRAVFLVKKSK